MNIVVLCGGVSSEREISLRSSAKVAGALRSRGHKVIMIDVFFGSDALRSFEEMQDYEKEADALRKKNSLITPERVRETGLFGPHVLDICRQSDAVFIGLHGKNGEDGKVQEVFDRERIAYTGSGAPASALAMDKARTKKRISPYIRMPRGIVVRRSDLDGTDAEGKLLSGIQTPCIIKPNNGGSSLGVIRVHDPEKIRESLEECFQYDETVLVEELIEGRELTQGVLNGRALPPVEICTEEGDWYDYTNKYNGITREVCPAQIPDEVLREMSRCSVLFGELLGLSVYYRIDYLLDSHNVLYALEANSLPGMTDTSLIPQEAAAVGISFPELCERIIELSLEKQKEGTL